MEIVHTLDIDGSQWELQDGVARQSIAEVERKFSEIINVKLGGTFSFSAKMKYLGEDETYKYYDFWWEPQTKTYGAVLTSIIVNPPNTTTDKILSININPYQYGNAQIYKATQHAAGANNSGMITYLFNATVATQWTFAGMGILRRKK